MNSDVTPSEWRTAHSVCLIDLKTIVGESDSCSVHSGNYGYRPRFKIDGDAIDHIATALGINTRCWHETRHFPDDKPSKQVAVNLASSEFIAEEVFNFHPDGCELKALRVKDYRGYLEIEMDMKSGGDGWTEQISYSGRYSIEWPPLDLLEAT